MSAMTIKELKGQIKLITGLHIGSGDEEVHIGGIDNPVIKDPDGFPYIPGSSLKGKMRSLLELSEGCTIEGKPSTRTESPNSLVPLLFGDTTGASLTRLLFRDAFLSKASKEKLEEKSILPTEAKAENSIDRLRGVASNPRTTERAIPGLVFDFSISLRLLDGDKEQDFLDVLKKGIFLIEKDALGGSGSRGYGKVEFQSLQYDGKDFAKAQA